MLGVIHMFLLTPMTTLPACLFYGAKLWLRQYNLLKSQRWSLAAQGSWPSHPNSKGHSCSLSCVLVLWVVHSTVSNTVTPKNDLLRDK